MTSKTLSVKRVVGSAILIVGLYAAWDLWGSRPPPHESPDLEAALLEAGFPDGIEEVQCIRGACTFTLPAPTHKMFFLGRTGMPEGKILIRWRLPAANYFVQASGLDDIAHAATALSVLANQLILANIDLVGNWIPDPNNLQRAILPPIKMSFAERKPLIEAYRLKLMKAWPAN